MNIDKILLNEKEKKQLWFKAEMTNRQFASLANKLNNADIENLNLVNVQLYPNPVVSILTVDFGQPINLDVIELTDALGRIIQTFKNFNGNQIHIDLEKESNGVYFLNLNLDQNTKTLRIIKQ